MAGTSQGTPCTAHFGPDTLHTCEAGPTHQFDASSTVFLPVAANAFNLGGSGKRCSQNPVLHSPEGARAAGKAPEPVRPPGLAAQLHSWAQCSGFLQPPLCATVGFENAGHPGFPSHCPPWRPPPGLHMESKPGVCHAFSPFCPALAHALYPKARWAPSRILRLVTKGHIPGLHICLPARGSAVPRCPQRNGSRSFRLGSSPSS